MSFWKKITGVLSGGVSDVAGAIIGGGGSSGGYGGGSSTNINQDSQIGASESGQSGTDATQGRDNAIVLGTNSKLNEAGIVLDGNATGNTITISDSSQKQSSEVATNAFEKPADGKPLTGDTEAKKSDSTLILWGVGLLVTVLAAIAFSRRKSA